MVSTLSIIFMICNMLSGILIPVGLLVFFKKKYRVSVKSLFIGCAVMLLFALILEQIVHAVVLGSQAGDIIKNHIWLYALYGGMMAGIFEESGRFLAMRFLLKKEHDHPRLRLDRRIACDEFALKGPANNGFSKSACKTAVPAAICFSFIILSAR